MIYNNSFPTAKKTQVVSDTNIGWLVLFKEIITLCSENRAWHSVGKIHIKYLLLKKVLNIVTVGF